MTEIGLQPRLFKSLGTEFVDPSAYSCLFSENIGQCVRHLIEIHIINEINKTLDNSMFVSKNGFNRINNSCSPHIHNIKIFELPCDFIPHISASM